MDKPHLSDLKRTDCLINDRFGEMEEIFQQEVLIQFVKINDSRAFVIDAVLQVFWIMNSSWNAKVL